MLMSSFSASFLVDFTLGLQAECDLQARQICHCTPSCYVFAWQAQSVCSLARYRQDFATCGCSAVCAGAIPLQCQVKRCVHHLHKMRNIHVLLSCSQLLTMLLQGSRIVQRYIDYKKLQRLMKDISGFSASQRLEGGEPMLHIQPKQVHQAACGIRTPLLCPVYCMFSLTRTSSDAVMLPQQELADCLATCCLVACSCRF